MYRQLLIKGYWLMIVQLIFLIVVGALIGMLNTWQYSWSIILGGSAWLAPNAYFMAKVFSSKTKAIGSVKNFMIGEIVKLLLSSMLIIGMILWLPIVTVAFLGGYGIAIITNLAASLLMAKRR